MLQLVISLTNLGCVNLFCLFQDLLWLIHHIIFRLVFFFFFNKKKFNFQLHYLIENIKNFLLLTNKLIQKPLNPLIILYLLYLYWASKFCISSTNNSMNTYNTKCRKRKWNKELRNRNGKKKRIMKCAINFNNWKYNWTVVHA